MLRRDQRLVEPAGFAAAVRSGVRIGGPLLVVHLGADSGPEARAGFVVSKAIGSAVARNRVKRRLRHLVRAHVVAQAPPVLPPGSVLVVRALPAAKEASYAELREELARCLLRALARTPGSAAGEGPRTGT